MIVEFTGVQRREKSGGFHVELAAVAIVRTMLEVEGSNESGSCLNRLLIEL